MSGDPPTPADGSCAECHGPRKMPASKLHRASAALDPFCSAECARAWYGVQLPSAKFSTSGNLPGYRSVGPRTYGKPRNGA